MDLNDVPTMDLRAELASRNAEHGNTTFVVRGRGGGKTTAAVAWVLSNPNSKLLVSTAHRKRDIERKSYGMAGRVFTVQDVKNGRTRGFQSSWVFDELGDILLEAGFPNVSLITATGVVE